MTSLGRVMGWHTSKTAKVCKGCKKVIEPGTQYLNIPKNYRSQSGNYCEHCDSSRGHWAMHNIDLDEAKERATMKKLLATKDRVAIAKANEKRK